MRAYFKIDVSNISQEFVIYRKMKEGIDASSAAYILDNIIPKLDEGEYEVTIEMKYLGK